MYCVVPPDTLKPPDMSVAYVPASAKTQRPGIGRTDVTCAFTLASAVVGREAMIKADNRTRDIRGVFIVATITSKNQASK
jgi:hypothetical protein